ncbi:uncharacterized protein [Antedon mediterranea]|uniref:uncharacterized protein n=1 Tax=Antedon mediterranea TaxID=105859 RepID=UPI003AF750E9
MARTFRKQEKSEKKVKLCLLVFLLFVAYLLIGSVIFGAIEKGNEEEATNKLLNDVNSFIDEHECIEERDIQRLLNTIRMAVNEGAYSVHFNSTKGELDLIWDAISGVFFCFTIVTTIGFGHITPKTTGGQVFCIAYASFGIPITGYLLSLLGDNFERFWTWYQRLLNKKLQCIRSVRLRRITIIAFGISIVLILTLFLPSYYWSLEEEWSYWISIYYTFITMTTIGFGDFVASIDDSTIPLVNRIFDLIVTIFTILLTLGLVTGILKIAAKRIEKSKNFANSRLSTMMKKLLGNEGMDDLNNTRSIKTISNDLAKCTPNGNHNNQLTVYTGPSSSNSTDDQNNIRVEDDTVKRRVSDTSQATDLSCADVSLEFSNRIELYLNKTLIISKYGLTDEMIEDIKDVINNHIVEAIDTEANIRNKPPSKGPVAVNGMVNGGFLGDDTKTRQVCVNTQDKRVFVDMHSDIV